MPFGKFFIIVAFSFAFIVVIGPADARMFKAKNSYVSLDLPGDFAPHERMAGFVSKSSGATVRVLDLPRAAYSQFENGFEASLSKKKYTEVRREKLHGRHDEHIFFFARQHTAVGQFDKYMLIFRNQTRAAYVTITVNPLERVALPLSYISAKNILAQVRLSDQQSTIRQSYGLSYIGDFKRRKAAIGTATLYVLKKIKKSDGKPMFVIAPSISSGAISDLEKTSHKLLQKFSRFRNIKSGQGMKKDIAGFKGFEISAQAVKKSSGKQVFIYQQVLVNPQGGYIRMVGVAPNDRFLHYLAQFRRMAASFHVVK